MRLFRKHRATSVQDVQKQLAREVARRKNLEEKLAEYTQRVERRVVQQTHDAADARRYAKNLVQAFPEFLLILDDDLRVVSANHTWYDRFKTTPEDTEGLSFFTLFNGSWDTPKLRSKLERVAKSGEAFEALELTREFPGTGKRTFLLHARRALGERQHLPLVLLSIIDVSDRKEAQDRVLELDTLRKKFVQIVAHQLRTPLNTIRWNLETLLAGHLGELQETQKEFIRMTYDANVEVVRRIGDLLIALDIEEGRITLDRREVSLVSLFESVRLTWEQQCSIKGLTCNVRLPKKPIPNVFADAEKTRQVFTAFLENAIAYTPSQGLLTLMLVQKGDFIRFTITDNGIGIPKAEQKNIFSRFFRATNAPMMKPDASGIGLSIAKFIVEQQGGRIGFTSREGKGSTFFFELPVHNSDA